jgi:hypothetical protein
MRPPPPAALATEGPTRHRLGHRKMQLCRAWNHTLRHTSPLPRLVPSAIPRLSAAVKDKPSVCHDSFTLGVATPGVRAKPKQSVSIAFSR